MMGRKEDNSKKIEVTEEETTVEENV